MGVHRGVWIGDVLVWNVEGRIIRLQHHDAIAAGQINPAIAGDPVKPSGGGRFGGIVQVRLAPQSGHDVLTDFLRGARIHARAHQPRFKPGRVEVEQRGEGALVAGIGDRCNPASMRLRKSTHSPGVRLSGSLAIPAL